MNRSFWCCQDGLQSFKYAPKCQCIILENVHNGAEGNTRTRLETIPEVHFLRRRQASIASPSP